MSYLCLMRNVKHCKMDFARLKFNLSSAAPELPPLFLTDETAHKYRMWWRRYLVGVPVAVKDDNGVGSLQVEAEATGSGAEQEDEVLRAFLIKFLQQHRSVLRLGGA